jgi:hypothetical protein
MICPGTPSSQGGDHARRLDDLLLEELVRQHARLAGHRDALDLVVLDHDALHRGTEPQLAAVRGDRVGQVGPHAVPALPGPAGVGGGAPLGEVHLADVQVVAGRVVPPLVGHALQHGDELEQVDHALVVGVLVQPLPQVPVVPAVEFFVGSLDERLDDLFQLGLAARVPVPHRPPGLLLVVPDRHLGGHRAVHEFLAHVLEHLGQAGPGVLDEVAAHVHLEALVRDRHRPAAQHRAAVGHQDPLALGGQQRPGGQPGGPGPDHHHVVVGHAQVLYTESYQTVVLLIIGM